MDFKRLHLFCKIVELKSFTRAAEAVHLSQPSVSENLRLLEESVGERLLDRLGREVVPTPAGHRLYPYAKQLLQLREEAWQVMAQFKGEMTGSLNIGTSTIPGTYILPAVIQEFKQLFPNCCVSTRITGSGAIVQGVLEGSYEFGVVGNRFREARCQFERLWEDQLAVVLPAHHPLARFKELYPEQLAEVPFVQREADSGTRLFTETALRDAGFDSGELQVVAELGSNEAVRQAVRVGLGIGILSLRAVADEVRRGDLLTRPVKGVKMRRFFYLVQRKKRRLSPLATTFLDHMRKVLEGSSLGM